jgi:hypothetical protein
VAKNEPKFAFRQKKKKKNSGSEGPGVIEVSVCARPHHSTHSTLGVDTRATNPRWRVDSMGPSGIGRGERREGENKHGMVYTSIYLLSLVLLALVDCFLAFVCRVIYALHILWRLCLVERP